MPRQSRHDGNLRVRVRCVVGPAGADHRKKAEAQLVVKAGTKRATHRETGEMARASARATEESEPGARRRRRRRWGVRLTVTRDVAAVSVAELADALLVLLVVKVWGRRRV